MNGCLVVMVLRYVSVTDANKNQIILEIPLLVGMIILAVSVTEFGEGDGVIVVVVLMVFL
jgi:hypothetical protein